MAAGTRRPGVTLGLSRMPSVAEIFETMAWGPAPEAAEPGLAWLEQDGRKFGHFVGGQWRAAAQTFAVFNPADRATLAHAGQGSPEDVDAAVGGCAPGFLHVESDTGACARPLPVRARAS